MTITVGDTLPNATLLTLGAAGPEAVDLSVKLAGNKVVIFCLPGVYTGVCSTSHVPSFMRTKDAFVEKGVSEVICISVNDPFVMQAWGESTGATAAGLTFLGDAEGTFIKEIGMDFTAPPAGLIGRSKRFAMVVDNGVVTVLHAEDNPGECDISGGEALLDAI